MAQTVHVIKSTISVTEPCHPDQKKVATKTTYWQTEFMKTLQEVLLAHEPSIRMGAFLSIFFIMAAWEFLTPRRNLTQPKTLRWGSNLAIVGLNTVVARLILPLPPVAFATLCVTKKWGILNIIDVPPWIAIIATVVIMDFAIWVQHVMVHAIPILWRLHRVHHADMDIDVTTGARFHPLEILLSLGIKFAVIALIGANPAAVLLFEIILNAMAMFNHANIRLPLALDHLIRFIFVTPDFHRVHHSVSPVETNSNFGFNLSIWDRLFGTYIAQPKLGHDDMMIGLDIFRASTEQRLDKMLTQPFRNRLDNYAINRNEENRPS